VAASVCGAAEAAVSAEHRASVGAGVSLSGERLLLVGEGSRHWPGDRSSDPLDPDALLEKGVMLTAFS
jgi:hypothetical protein